MQNHSLTEKTIEEFLRKVENKMNIIIRITSLRKREYFARRLGFEVLGHLCGGHPLPKSWKEEDWDCDRINKTKVKELPK